MTNQPDDPIRARLAGHDPLRQHPHIHPAEPPAHLLEQIMNNNTAITEASTTEHATAPRRHRRRNWTLAGTGVAVAAAVAGILAFTSASPAPTTMELGLGADDVMASCMPVSADILVDMPLAFAGTAVSVEGETVTLDVTNWYTGGDTDQVILTATAGMEALIGGIAFEPGGTYLVAATGGVVNYCGYTGPATPELAAVYDAAFSS